jgi:5-methylcytosine-specific restriction endonuclease McrA
MTSPSIPKALREQVKRRAGFRCEYCQTSEWLNGIEGEIDHIIPRAEGGTDRSDKWIRAGYHPPPKAKDLEQV